ncbi:aminotransferase class III-fold pyridoxal phosphate-dependent enzyme [Massilia sp. W12]|uniref:aspartate aminotransferase family protein n=1 Tax=Massilia sp. W12 TaxID=3126507 RepID=UPI0030CEC7BC
MPKELHADWEARARASLAGTVTHDSWICDFDPIVFSHANGPYKWDVNGKRYLDLWMGHGAMMLGHNRAEVSQALIAQASRGTHLSGNHALLVRWAEQVVQMIPSAEQVRFCASGTEATLLALRLARACTGRQYIVRVDGHFHGWHDESLSAFASNWPIGSHPHAASHIRLARAGSIDSVTELLQDHLVAALILEPGGGSSGLLPYDPEYLKAIRQACNASGTLLIFDEVMSGFRYAPGGVQEISKVMPDITTLSKVLCGGLPGAALVGRSDIMQCFDIDSQRKVAHSGTFNGNPLAAAAGLATLQILQDGSMQNAVNLRTAQFVTALNHTAQKHNLDLRLFHQASIIHIVLGAVAAGTAVKPSAEVIPLIKGNTPAYNLLRREFLAAGIDMHRTHGWLSCEHSDTVLDEAVEAANQAFGRLAGNARFQQLCPLV